MSLSLLEPVELRSRGFYALVKALEWVNAVRFIQQFECSRRDYTRERDELLPRWDAAEIMRQLDKVDPA